MHLPTQIAKNVSSALLHVCAIAAVPVTVRNHTRDCSVSVEHERKCEIVSSGSILSVRAGFLSHHPRQRIVCYYACRDSCGTETWLAARGRNDGRALWGHAAHRNPSSRASSPRQDRPQRARKTAQRYGPCRAYIHHKTDVCERRGRATNMKPTSPRRRQRSPPHAG